MLRNSSMMTLALVLATTCFSQTLPLPRRPANAISCTDFVREIEPLPLAEREQAIVAEILAGNVPASLTNLRAVNLTNIINGQTDIATIFVTRDYLPIGTDAEHFLTPLTPATAQRIADELGCLLPTRKMVDAIYAAAQIKLAPQPIPPDAKMTTVPAFAAHNKIIRTQLLAVGKARISIALIAGHKKDVVITAKLGSVTNKVAIYGWHSTNGVAIQPLYLGHTSAWVDYSHGIRLVSQTILLNGQWTNITAILSDTNLCQLLSDEGVIAQPRYSTNFFSPGAAATIGPRWPQGFVVSKNFGEMTREFTLPDKVRVLINAPPVSSFATNKPVQLIFFALPNGNTIEQTIGKQMQPGDDWHFNIQHIAAQTRFLRNFLTNQTIVVAYLENSLKSWPAWRRTNGNDRIPALFNAVRDTFVDYRQEIVLTGHSGGGSLTFGYLNAVEKISSDIKRIAFLDSNYAFETTNHLAKLVNWLKETNEASLTNRSVPVPGHSNAVRLISSEQFQAARNLNIAAPEDGRTPQGEGTTHYLCVLAYHDSIALLDGKTFVSERGGTWGRSHAMLEDLRHEFPFTSSTNSAGLQSHVAANGRIQLLLKENPEKKILHTVQVDRNGFIHAMLTGTPLENRGYEYFGERAYERWIQEE